MWFPARRGDILQAASEPGKPPAFKLTRAPAPRNLRAMKQPIITRLAALTLVLSTLGAVPARAADTAADWQSLFNGKDLSGWAPLNDGVFTVTNGYLQIVKGMGWLHSEKEYGDFILELEWRALEPSYNSGVFVRCGLEGKPFPPEGWQVNLKDRALGSLMRGSKTVVPAETPPMPINKWVKFRIEVRGKKITLDVDGERAWSYEGLDRDRGYIGLQAEGKAFDIRSVRLLESPPAAAK